MTTLLKVCGAIQNIVFGRVLLSLRLLCRADDCVSNLDCAALRATTDHEGESANMLFDIFSQLLKLCGVIRKFDHPFAFVLRRIDPSPTQQLSDCAAGGWVNYLSYNHITPSELLKNAKCQF